MGYIYKIINDINNKVYIGKTQFPIQKRWKQHCRDYKKEKNEKRPLYNAMKKYGIQHFSINLIEESNDLENKEKYWIKQYDSYKNGYNATLGGDSKHYLDYDLIIKIYQKTKNINETSRLTGAHPQSISAILKQNNIEIKSSGLIAKQKLGIKVSMIDKNTDEILQTFLDQTEAAKWLQQNEKTSDKKLKNISTNIGRVVNGKRKTAYGYKWKKCN